MKEDLPILPISPVDVDYNGLYTPKVTSDFWEDAINTLKEAIAFENGDPEVVKNTVVRTLND